MDSLSQAALGAAVGVAVMGRRTALWKAAAWGALAGTLPDLDVFVDYGNPVHDMVLHRAASHSLFWLTLLAMPLAALPAWLHRRAGATALYGRWWLAIWLALVTHPLLDTMTVYGTQLALPFTNHPFGVGSVFIIDPLYTLPLLVGLAVALARTQPRACTVALATSTVYLGWGVLAQQHVHGVVRETLATQQLGGVQRVLVTPTAFNSVAWRVVVMREDDYLEGFYSLLDAQRRVPFDRFDRGRALAAQLRGIDGYERVARFSKGFYAVRQDGPRVIVSDLRMGQQPTYTFSFAVAEQGSPLRPLPVPQAVGQRPSLERALPWLWRRIGGEVAPPPR